MLVSGASRERCNWYHIGSRYNKTVLRTKPDLELVSINKASLLLLHQCFAHMACVHLTGH